MNEIIVRGFQAADMSYRSYPVAANTWKDEDRGIDAVIATENPVYVWDDRNKRVIQEVLLMTGVKLPESKSLPLQDSHKRDSVRHTLGSTRNLHVEGGQLLGRNHISAAEPDVATKVKEGHIPDNSIGYIPTDREIIDPGTEREVLGIQYRARPDMPLQVTTGWMPLENSLTPIGADSDAKQRSMFFEEKKMADEKKPEAAVVPESKPADKPAETIGTETVKPAENLAISNRAALEAITPRGYESIMERAIIEGMDVEALRAALREEHAKRLKPVGTPETKPVEKPDITVEEFHRAITL